MPSMIAFTALNLAAFRTERTGLNFEPGSTVRTRKIHSGSAHAFYLVFKYKSTRRLSHLQEGWRSTRILPAFATIPVPRKLGPFKVRRSRPGWFNSKMSVFDTGPDRKF